jgi:pyruvate dehydrogenase E2 component (dihydrolipoamide acetyltransferase)
MVTEVVMPKLGLTMEMGTIGAWLVSEGGEVSKGSPLLEVVTDKVTMEVESQVSGVLRKILVAAGEEVLVATPIGIIGGADEEIGAVSPDIGTPDIGTPDIGTPDIGTVDSGSGPQSADVARVAVPRSIPDPAPSGRRGVATARPHRASPKARKMAAESGLDLAAIVGTGTGGRIVSADIAAYLADAPSGRPGSIPSAALSPETASDAGERASASEVAEIVELTSAQRLAAQRLTESSREIPHIHVSMEVSAGWLVKFREGFSDDGTKVSYNDLILKATAKTLSEFPRFNSLFIEGQVHQFRKVNLGIATDTPVGLMVPVLRDVADLSVTEIALESARLVDLARHGRLTLADVESGTFTVSNLGMFGVSSFSAIINPPQVAILAVGSVENRVVAVRGDALAARPQLTLNLAADHRAVDGAMCARFLLRLKEVLESPSLLA